MEILNLLKKCELCPRKCRIDRTNGQVGYCRAGYEIKAAKAMLHMWEEPCISAGHGSGAVFFSDCSMSCVFCQNYNISQEHMGKKISIERLSEIFIEFQNKGANNINLVSPTHYVPQIIKALSDAKHEGLKIPVIYNSNGYECIETLKHLNGLIDIYLPDLKYYSERYSVKYSNAPDYFRYASAAILEMYRQVGSPFIENRLMKKGLIIRHLLLPGMLSESKKILDWISDNLPKDVYISLMSQYVPMYKAKEYPEINKRVKPQTYEWLIDYALSLGLNNGFLQECGSANDTYTPEFNFEGL